jgi:hypothetical protein
VPEAQDTHNRHDTVTLDESWFRFSLDHEPIWLAPALQVLEREWHMIQCPKLMITVVWNASGFAIMTALRSGIKFPISSERSEILHESKD